MTRDGVLDDLPDGVTLSELGTWRFQGLREPEELFQVEAEGLRRNFPPLRAAKAAFLGATRF